MNNGLRVGWMVASVLMPLSAQGIKANAKADAPTEAETHSSVGKVKEINVVHDSKRTSVLLYIESGHILLDEFRILFDNGRARDAWWSTKGMFSIALPKEGLLLKDLPGKNAQINVVFDRDVPKKSTYVEGITLLSIRALKKSARTPVEN